MTMSRFSAQPQLSLCWWYPGGSALAARIQLNMNPALAINNSPDSGLGNSELLGQCSSAEPSHATLVMATNSEHLQFRQLPVAVTITGSLSPFAVSVGGVYSVIAFKKMVRAAATRVIAAVQNVYFRHIFRRQAMVKRECQSVSVPEMFSDACNSVAGFVFGTVPNPAFRGFVQLGPKNNRCRDSLWHPYSLS